VDPWVKAMEKYRVGQMIEGTVLKINPFGVFVELDQDIHGLAHISELSEERITNPLEVVKEGERLKFKVLSIEPENHRLGLSLKALKEKKSPPKKTRDIKEEPQEKTEKDKKENTAKK